MFCYRYKQLILKQGETSLPLIEIAKKEKSPFYLYDIQGLREWYQFFSSQMPAQVFFAMKSNFNKWLLKALQKEGAGVDVVSGGEASLAMECGFSPQKIVFSGVGKSKEELEMALRKKFFQINVESFEELKRLAQISSQKNQVAPIALRITPNIDFPSHPYIKTGLSGHKFGLEISELKEILAFIKKSPSLSLQGLSMHLGSQIFDLKPLLQAIQFLKRLYEQLKQENWALKTLDIGGGLGINYQKEDQEQEKARLTEFGQALKDLFKNSSAQLLTEPGRFLVARFGLLCAKVEYVKKSSKKQFVILNSGMNHFLRPALYSAQHRILSFKLNETLQKYDVVGPICETGDSFAKDILLPEIKEGEYLAIADTGAYGFVMANSYNLQLPVTETAYDQAKKL